MKRYDIQITREATVSTIVRLDANTREEAERLAKARIVMPNSLNCDDWYVLDHEWTISDCEYNVEKLPE